MDTKFVIFVFISTFLIAAIYSSSVSVFAKEPHCVTSPDGKTKFCYVGADNPDDPITTVLCTKTSSGWNCKNYARSMDTKIPPALNDAIDAAIQESQNTTKAPNTDILKDNNVLQGDNNTSNDNVKEPKAPKVPEDLSGLNDDGG